MKHLFKCLFITTLLAFSAMSLQAQMVHGRSSNYTYPEEENILQRLDEWQDLKFGMIIHWGLYAELGIVESWSICSEEEDWIGRDSTVAYDEYKRWYWSTIDKFKPVNLDASVWAKKGREAGMKYLVFTTKHHDGFCLFDTKETDFSITKGAFKDDPRSNVTKEIFNAFRDEGYWIGAYYSKPDWHSQYYWWDRYATPNRSNNYNIDKNPWRWGKFKEFVHNQIEELVNGDYGKVDILWLDGGWVRKLPEGYKPANPRTFKGEQDIDMPKLAQMVRSYQPDMLIVDRTVPGKYENYQTPERGIPDTQLDNPWESCMPLGYDWGYVPTDIYRSPQKVIHSLIEIVAKGGNLLLGIGPKPDGTLPEGVTTRIEKIGEWLDKNGDAIYKTRITPVYHDDKTWFTQSKDAKTIYAIYCHEEDTTLPKTITWKGNVPAKGAKMTCLHTKKSVKWTTHSDGTVEVTLPQGLPNDIAAVAFSYKKK